jgi:hypothetical protein
MPMERVEKLTATGIIIGLDYLHSGHLSLNLPTILKIEDKGNIPEAFLLSTDVQH